MAAKIELPDGTPAMIFDGVWICPDPDAIPVLNYFSERTIHETFTNSDDETAREVAAMIVGARFIFSDPTEPLPPGYKT